MGGGGVYWSRGGWGPREGIMQEYIALGMLKG